MNLSFVRFRNLVVLCCVVVAIVVGGWEAVAAEPSGDPSRAAASGVFTGRFANGMPIYRLPPVHVVASRKIELAKIAREDAMKRPNGSAQAGPTRGRSMRSARKQDPSG
jgi:hypothetical protein